VEDIAPVAVAADDADIYALLMYQRKPGISDISFFSYKKNKATMSRRKCISK